MVPRPDSNQKLPEHSQTVERDGVSILVTTYHTGQVSGRLEIVLEACGQTAIVDVPADGAANLRDRIEEAITGFWLSLDAHRNG